MNKLNYDEIKTIFNSKIFENSKTDLLTKLADTPNRYIGIFRPTKPKTKIIQNITQSHEIKFGDAFELLIRKCFEHFGYKSLERKIKIENNYVDLDQLFEKNNRVILIEQKIRDDHDSTKKRGQIENFEKKINLLIEKYDCDISCYFYFIDSDLQKNRNYYDSEINKMRDAYKLDINICYGNELFIKEGFENAWEQEIISFLKEWRKDLPDLPEINFDINHIETFDEVKNIQPLYFRKLLDNEELVKTIFPIIFPNSETLKLLSAHFKEKSLIANKQQQIYSYLHQKLNLVI